jgi:phospholipid transport system substrate-binding protein
MALGGTLFDRRSLIAGLALLGALMPVRAVGAARATAAAEEVVQRLVDRLWQVLAEQGVGALDEQGLLAVLEEGTDLTLLGRLVLGRYWRDANPRQRTMYLQLFRRYMVQTFVQRLRQYAGNEAGQPGPAFQVVASRPVGNSDILVQSRVLPSGGQPLRVDWRLRERPDGPVVIDLIVEGISLLVTQRSEFAAVLERTGVDGLLTELNARVTQPTQPT